MLYESRGEIDHRWRRSSVKFFDTQEPTTGKPKPKEGIEIQSFERGHAQGMHEALKGF